MIKTSGEKQEFSTGAHRDTQDGKGKPSLIPAIALRRLAVHYEEGAKLHGENNWKKGMPLARFLDSAFRHILDCIEGKEDEDHVAAVLWNMCGFIWTQDAIRRGKLPKELDDLCKDLDEECWDHPDCEEPLHYSCGPENGCSLCCGEKDSTLGCICGECSEEVHIDKHITNEFGDCVSWCSACGPICEHGDNSKECEQCKGEKLAERMGAKYKGKLETKPGYFGAQQAGINFAKKKAEIIKKEENKPSLCCKDCENKIPKRNPPNSIMSFNEVFDHKECRTKYWCEERKGWFCKNHILKEEKDG